MYGVKPGPANQSYGIQVAKLAGLPNSVLETAKSKLNELEDQLTLEPNTVLSTQQSIDFSDNTQSSVSAAEIRLREIDPDDLSAREALSLIYELSDMVK